MFAGVGAILAGAMMIGAIFYLVAHMTGREETMIGRGSVDWEATPGGMLFSNLLLASLIPVAMMAVWAGFRWRPRWLASVTGGVRWRWLAICAGVALAVFVGPSLALTLATENVATWTAEPQWPALLMVVIVTTPLQSAGEEYLFRGWLPQTIGSLFKAPWLGAVVGCGVASVLFALAHGQQDPWLFADRLVFGLVACWLVWRTGGLEAGIAVHAVNNLSVFAITIAQGQLANSLSVTRAEVGEVALDVVTLLIAGVILTVLACRLRVVRLFVPPQA
jgi:membrane protease YdiL (CAAX protease family)